jgi:hypothetical protein
MTQGQGQAQHPGSGRIKGVTCHGPRMGWISQRGVLQPGGHLVTSDSRSDWPVVKALPGGDFGYLPHRNHRASDYLAAALPRGFQVRRCEEPPLPYPAVDPNAKPLAPRPITRLISGRCGPGARPPSTPSTVTVPS